MIIAEKLTPEELDMLISDRLNTAQLVLREKSIIKEADNDKDKILGLMQAFSNLILELHSYSFLEFSLYCLPPLTSVFSNEKNTLDEENYLFVHLAVAGYKVGSLKYEEGPIRNKEFYEKMRTMFSGDEFEQIARACKKLITGLSEQATNSYQWCRDTMQNAKRIKSAKKEMNDEFKIPLYKILEKGVTDEAIQQIQPLGDKMATYATTPNFRLLLKEEAWSKLYDRGVLNPADLLMQSLERITNYLEIMHYAGYLDLAVQSRDPNQMKFGHYYHSIEM